MALFDLLHLLTIVVVLYTGVVSAAFQLPPYYLLNRGVHVFLYLILASKILISLNKVNTLLFDLPS